MYRYRIGKKCKRVAAKFMYSSRCPELEAYKQGRDIFLGFKEDLSLAVSKVFRGDCDDVKQFIWPDQHELSGEIC